MNDTNKDAMSVVGVGAAACAACCAVPIMGVIAAAGLAAAVAYAAAGAIALTIAVPALVWAIRKRRAAPTCSTDPGPQPVELGARNATPR